MAPCNHALLAPSASARWTRCPASAYWTARAPAGESSVHAKEGTWAHLLAERLLNSEEGFTDSEIAEIVKSGFDPESFKLPVSLYVDYVTSLPGNRMTEQVLFVGSVTGEKGAVGTADAVVISDDGCLNICDLKFGKGVRVDADHNTQLIIYAGAFIEEFGWLYDFNRVVLHIIQPRLDHISTWEVSPDALRAEIEKIKLAAARCLALLGDHEVPDAPEDYVPCEAACRWCPFNGKCGALARFSLSAAGLDLPSCMKPALDGAAVADILNKSDLIKKWLDSVAETACASLLAGENIPGYKVVAGRSGNREWTDEDKAEKMLKGWKVPSDVRYVKKLITPAAAEKLIKLKTITDEQWGELSALVSRSPGKPTLAPESDKRPAITSKPSAEDYPDENKK